jgi:acyl carrier protein
MLRSLVRDRIQKIFEHHFMVPAKKLRAKNTLDQLGFSEWDKREMLNYIEQEFRIDITANEEPRIQTVYDTISYVTRKLA